MRTIRIEIQVQGNLYKPCLWLDGNEIALQFSGPAQWTRTIDAFPVTGPLHLEMRSGGQKGTAWQLALHLEDSKNALKFSGELSRDYLSLNREVPVI